RSLAGQYPARAAAIGDVALEGQRLSSAAAGVHAVSLTVRRGEVVGVAGLAGSGRTEVAGLIIGIRRPDRCTVRVAGVPAKIAGPADAIAHGIAYLPEDRRRHGVLVDMPIAANTSLATLGAHSRRGIVLRERERETATHYVG